jgi:hypothetical protein
LVVVGNEVLSGKTQDSNAYFATRQLRAIGVALQRITVLPDEIPLIAAEVSYCARRFDIVLTAAGVGKLTHDVTMDGVAAFGRSRYASGTRAPHPHFADPLPQPRSRWPRCPRRRANSAGDLRFPTIQLERHLSFPASRRLPGRLVLLGASRPIPIICARFAGRRGRGPRRQPEVSCAAIFAGPSRVGIRISGEADAESQDHDYLERAFAHLMSLLPGDVVVKTE